MSARLFEDVVVSSHAGGWSPALPASVALHVLAAAFALAAFERAPLELPALAAIPTVLRMPVGVEHPALPPARRGASEPSRSRSAWPVVRATVPQPTQVPTETPSLEPAAENAPIEGNLPGCEGCSPEGERDGVLGGAGAGTGVHEAAPVEPVHVGGRILQPQKLHHVNPEYPAIARAAGVQGTVILECVIGTDGRVTDVRVLRGVPLLDAAAVAAVQQWVYSPTRLNDQPVAVIMTVTVRFNRA